LEYYWPNADSHIDICKTDFKKYANRIDILTGGFPCQPFSLAGKRKGKDDERYLWGEMLRAIQEIKPTWIIAENVFGIVNIDGGLVFEQVCIDLENEGYEVQPFIIPAAAKNAPHRRDRCWFIAYSESIGYRRRSEQSKSNQSKEWQICENEQQHRDAIRCEIEGCSWNATDTDLHGCNECNGNNEINPSEGRINAFGNAEQGNGNGNATDTESICIQGQRNRQGEGEFRGSYWSRFPTQSPICGGDDGLPTQLDGITFSKWRNESIKGYGNAIVPQIAYELFKIIEHEHNK
jgi:DNA (cytosine-5)-methyltransferase 1